VADYRKYWEDAKKKSCKISVKLCKQFACPFATTCFFLSCGNFGHARKVVSQPVKTVVSSGAVDRFFQLKKQSNWLI